MKKVVYLGIPGSYSFLAACKFFSKAKVNMIGKKNFKEIANMILNNQAFAGVLPLENSTSGRIYEVYDLLLSSNLKIIGEVIMRIKHSLLVKRFVDNDKKMTIKNLKRCYSHPEAIKQCQNFFDKHKNIKPVFTSDTASAAKKLLEEEKTNVCAIAGNTAACNYNLRVLLEDLADNKSNYTRFICITKKMLEKGNKVSLVFSVEHKPGSLFRTLEPYARFGLNLTKIESRPIFDRPWEYIFFVDLEINGKEKEWDKVLSQMKKTTNFIKVLGRYDSIKKS